MSKPQIYLASKMSGLSFEIMNKSRLEATKLLEDYFIVQNPVNYFNFEIDKSHYTDSEVKRFDLALVKSSQIVLLDLEYPDSIGTAIEVHMAHDVWDIPVIAYGGDFETVHPWIKLSVTHWFETLEEAVEHILRFYLPSFK